MRPAGPIAAPLVSTLLALTLLGPLPHTIASAQRGPVPLVPDVPPVSMTCPMHPDIVEAAPGLCPLCRMKLEPVRLDVGWACPIHPHITSGETGACRVCGRDLGRVTVAITWRCPSQPGVDHLEPGPCADGSRMVMARTVRPHGDHNPRYGGQFFMAPDNWHHLEGTYPESRVFRLYVYDNYSMPLAAEHFRRVQGHIVTYRIVDPVTRVMQEGPRIPLRPSSDRRALEAQLDAGTLPAELTAFVRFAPSLPEHRFDFTFHTLTVAPAPPVPPAPSHTSGPRGDTRAAPAEITASVGPADPTVTRPESPVVDPSVSDGPIALPAPDPGFVPLPVPESLDEILAQLRTRHQQIDALIATGNLQAVFVPAFHAKDLAIALEERLQTLPATRRQSASAAIQHLVRTAWLLDAFGDIGNRQRLTETFTVFSATVDQVVTAFSDAP